MGTWRDFSFSTEMGERNLDEEEVEIGEKKAKLAEKIADAGAKVTEAREVEGKREAESGKIQERIHVSQSCQAS